jgi:hypothetical protein
MPGPSSSTSIVTVSDEILRRIVASEPNLMAFSTRLVMLRCRSSKADVDQTGSIKLD